MFSILKAPFPSDFGGKNKVLSAVLVGFFVAAFLFAFKPFGSAESDLDTSGLLLKFAGYGVVSFLGMLFVDFIIPKLAPNFFIESSYTVGKELWMSVVTIFVIGIANALYANWIVHHGLGLKGVIIMIWQTFLVGIFPLSFTTITKYNRLLKSNMAISAQIRPESTISQSQELKETNSSPSYTLITETETTEIDLSDLLYMESVGNYVNVATFKNGELSRNLYRKTLKSIEEDVADKSILRCHRSYIVNLSRVTEVKGNAQGLKLSMKDTEESIPVSRKYIPVIKGYFT